MKRVADMQPIMMVVALVLPLFIGLAAVDVWRGGPLVSAAAARLGLPLPDAPTIVVRVGDAPLIEVREGVASPPDLAAAVAREGQPDLVALDDGAWTVDAEIRVLRGGVLEVDGATMRLAGGIEARGGHVDVRDARIVGWSTATTDGAVDRDASDGRAWMAAGDGGRLTIEASTISHLGRAEDGREGISWTGLDSSGSLSGSTVQRVHDIVLRQVEQVAVRDTRILAPLRDGISQIGGGPLTYESVTVRDAGRSGVRLAEASGGELVGVRVDGAAGAGIAVVDDSAAVVVAEAEISDAAAGVWIHDSQGVNLRDSDVYHNTIGVLVEGAASRAELAGNRIAGNDQEGLFVRNGSRAVVVRDNRIDRNGRAGLALVGADVTVTSNVMAQNADGVRIGDQRSTGVLADNRVIGNIEDGIDLPEQQTLDITDNVIADNRSGAFSVLTSGRSDAVAGGNQLRGNGDGQERVREE